jgi:tetratricopeptide (TPR) repeat protein
MKHLLLLILLISQSLYSSNLALADENFPYSAQCKQFGLRRPLAHPEWDAATGVRSREKYEIQGMKLHEQGKWKDSNCLLIHALNVSSDHALNIYNVIGFNYAALGNDKEALKYFEDATAYDFDLDTWLEYKKKPFFKPILSEPIYKNHEEQLRRYYRDMGLPIPNER